jgi:tRNA modification GTPase
VSPGAEDTIAAISTPPGLGGIGIVRLSGPESGKILGRIFRRRGGPGPLLSHRFYLGEILRPGDQKALDEVLAVFMGKPKTYTREDVVEIQAHGGPLALREILEVVLQNGARLAEPGEFTRRAFLNGRIDLTQAEAVIDLIQSKTRRSLELANLQRQGRLAEELGRIREDLLNLTALLEAGIDFPEEEVPEVSRGEVARRLEGAQNRLGSLLRTYDEGKIYREGISVAIVGRPNVGKSSLLNSLLREDRAIVTPIPGTTRDVVEEVINIRGIPVKMMDTAGLRPAKDAIEMEGIRRTRDRMARADLIIWVIDGSELFTSEDLDILPQVGEKKTVIAVNKMDLARGLNPRDLTELVPQFPQVPISALHQTNIDRLEDAIRGQILNGRMEPDHEILLTNLRHKQAVEGAQEALAQAQQSWEAGLPSEFITLDLARSLQFLGKIVGETTTEDLLDRIFSHFCIGK